MVNAPTSKRYLSGNRVSTDFGLALRYPTRDGAVGPAQFLPGSWANSGQDANHDGTDDPQNVFDAALATVAHLCLPSPGDYANLADLARSLRRYNNSPLRENTQAYRVSGWGRV